MRGTNRGSTLILDTAPLAVGVEGAPGSTVIHTISDATTGKVLAVWLTADGLQPNYEAVRALIKGSECEGGCSA